MTTGANLSTAGATVVEVDAPEASLDLAAAVRAGARSLRIAPACALSIDEPRPTIALIRLLRKAASYGLPVTWHGRVEAGIDASLFVHLSPPEFRSDVDADTTNEWRVRHQTGLCYYRVGPDFVFVKDVRERGAAARYLFDDDAPHRFATLEKIADVSTLDTATAGLLNDLLDERLALQLGCWATLLPYRMRRWPVPAIDV